MLHIALLLLVARKGYIQAGQQATFAVFQPFGLVQEIGGKVLVAKKEPVFTLAARGRAVRSEEHTSELQSRPHLVCRLLLEKKKKQNTNNKSAWKKDWS